MKTLKILLIVFLAALLFAVGWFGYAWYTLTHPASDALGTASVEVEKNAPEDDQTTDKGSSVLPAATETIVPDKPITVSSDSLTKDQQVLLERFGLDSTEITITPKMVECAEGALGSARIGEIVAGASPTSLESLRLLPCIR